MVEPQFGILGPLEAVADGRQVELGGPKPRRLLAVLLLHVGDVVSVDRLVEAVWEDDPTTGAEATLRRHVANLRRMLASAGVQDVVVTRSPGYRLVADRTQVDAGRFERLVSEGRAALEGGDAAGAADTLQGALELWRGQVLEDLGAPRFAEVEAARLDELRLTAREARIDADLTLGRHGELIGELEALVDAHPFREQLWCQLMLALYRSGRQADALEAFRAVRQRLDEDLGLAPGPALAELETAILRHDPALAFAAAPAVSAPAQGEVAARARGPGPPDALFDVVRRVPMVGRADELGRLLGLWEVVRDGGRRVALLSGEAGVGKTRLVAELVAGAAEEGAVVLVGRCEPAALIPYQPVAEALRASPQAAQALDEEPEPVRSRAAPLLEGPAGPHPPRPAGPEGPEEQRSAFLDAVAGLFARMADQAPVVFIVEEAETIDQASARLLRHLARRLPEHLLLLVCFRDPPGSRHPPLRELLADLEGGGIADRLSLAPLSEPDLAALVTSWTGSKVPAQLVHALWSSTGGNPFFASEIVRDLTSQGRLEHADEAWRVPTGVRDVLRQRLGTLSELTQQIVACAAVLGHQADAGLLTQVAAEPEDRVTDALQEAADAGWLVETGREWEPRYAFRHALMRQAVHADIPASRRQRLHLLAADALQAAGLRRAEHVAAAAGHLRAAGALADRKRTADLSLQAADAAADLYAWDEAIGHAEAAVAILDHAGAPPDQQADAAAHAGDLLLKSTIDYPRAIGHYEAALEHHRAAGDETGVAEVRSRLGSVLSIHHSVMDIPRALEHFSAAEGVLTEGAPAFDVHSGKAVAAMFGLRTHEGCAAADRAVHLAESLGRRDLVALARARQAVHRFNRGELAAAHTLMEEAWATAQDLGDPHLGWHVVTAGAMISTMYLLDPAAGAAWCRRALAMPRFGTILRAQQGVDDQLVYALASMGELAAAREAASQLPADAVSQRLLRLLDGDWEAVEGSWANACAHDLDNGDRMNATLNAYWIGQIRGWIGHQGDAVAALRRGLAISCDGPQVPAELMLRAELARLQANLGDTEAAGTHLARCDEILADGEDWRGQTGNVELARGAIAAARGDHDQAHDAHRRALETFGAFRLPWWRGQTLHAWAGWLTAAGRTDEAETTYRAAQAVYDELGAADRWRQLFTVLT